MSGGDILNVGTSALLAFQQALNTTGNNISNVNTDGYSRERVNLVTQPALQSSIGSIGNGVQISDIQRLYDDLIAVRVNDATASQTQAGTYNGLASQFDSLLGSSNTGLSPAMLNFFNDVQGVADNPSSTSSRQTMLSDAQALTAQFSFYSTQLSSMQHDINSQLASTVTDINSLASGIADLNRQIASSVGSPSDLLDKRDLLIQQLSQDVGVKTVKQDDGSVNVFIGNGQSLVVGTQAQPISIVSNPYDPLRSEVGYESGGTATVISDQLSGGKLGGLLQARSDVLDPAQNALGRISISLASDFNTQHKLGMDLNGNPGQDFFTVASPRVLDNVNNTGAATVSANIVNTGDLTTSDYRLTYNGADVYTLTRTSDNQTFSINTGGSYPYTTDSIDGLSLTITGGAAVNDSFLIQPTHDGAAGISLAISNPAEIAAAAPVLGQASTVNAGSATITPGTVNSPNDNLSIAFNNPPTSFDVTDATSGATLASGVTYVSGSNIAFNGLTFQISDGGSAPAAGDTFSVNRGVTIADASNTGGGVIGAATVNSPDPNLTDPVTITFNNPPTSFNVAGATTGSPVVNVPYTDGSPISFNGWTVAISGTPSAGDTFTVQANSSGVGDNRNALLLAGIQTAKGLDGGATSLQDAYNQLVTDVGTKTHQSDLTQQTYTAVLTQAQKDQQSVSGVNLDEEAANMVRYQQAYQAAAQLISVSSTLFNTLLASFR
jgi:flagellar hook-associated protein 1 FlgK